MKPISSAYEYVDLLNRTVVPQELQLASGDTVSFPAGIQKRVDARDLGHVPDLMKFELVNPTIQDLIAAGVITLDGDEDSAPAADSSQPLTPADDGIESAVSPSGAAEDDSTGDQQSVQDEGLFDTIVDSVDPELTEPSEEQVQEEPTLVDEPVETSEEEVSEEEQIRQLYAQDEAENGQATDDAVSDKTEADPETDATTSRSKKK